MRANGMIVYYQIRVAKINGTGIASFRGYHEQ